jgi:mono/diheme cytochrome c family protein
MWLSAAVLMVGTVSAHAQTGDVSAGKAFWSGNATLCRQCHGANGEGGFGPDLAGRALTVDQFERAVRQPWGVMPAFTEEQISRQQIMNLVAFFDSLPRVAAPAAWRVPLESNMPLGQQLATANGCTQCHGAELPQLRAALGAVAPDYAWFSRLVYAHTAEMPALEKMLGDNAPIRMGNFSQLRLTEPTLQEIWKYISADLGWRARVQARMMPGTPATGGMAYSVSVTNAGVPGKAPTVEDVTVSVTLAPGTTVVGTTGDGYQGTRKDEKGLDVATWRIPRMAPRDAQTLTITVSGNAPTAGAVRWVKPAQKNGATFDTVNVAMPPRAAATQ